MTLFLQFNTVPTPSPQDGSPVDCNEMAYPRPFVPSVAPEDLEKAEEVGILTPKCLADTDKDPKPFVHRMPTWADRTRGCDLEKDHNDSHQKMLDDIAFLKMMDEQESHEDMLDEASEWFEEQEKILYGLSDTPSFMVDMFDIGQKEMIPEKTIQDIKVVRVEDKWSLGSINGVTNVYIPWGSKTSTDNLPGKIVSYHNRKPLRYGEFVCAFLDYTPEEKNMWKATKILPKFNTSDMLVSMVESKTEYISDSKSITCNGYQYTFDMPCDPANIGSIIGKSGKNVNYLIQGIQKKCEGNWYEPIPEHFDDKFPLPEVTITPVEAPDGITGPSAFTPQKVNVRVFCPTCCIWDRKDVEELVSYMHC